MKRSLIRFSLVASLALAAIFATAQAADTDSVRHVVVFKYKDAADESQIKEITDAFRALKEKIPGILSFEHGENNSPENLNRGFTHVYLLTFENAAARDAYLPHPEHKAFGKLLGESGILAEAFVIDYVPKE